MNPRYLICLMIMIMCITPAYANDISFTAPKGNAISNIYIDAPINSEGTIYATQEDGNITECTWTYISSPGLLGVNALANITLPGQSTYYNYYSFSLDSTDNLKLNVKIQGDIYYTQPQLAFSIGMITNYPNRIISNPIGHSPLMTYHIISTSDVTVTHTLIPYADAVEAMNARDQGNDWVEYILSLVTMFIGFVIELVKWIKFFFIDNLLLTLSLYIAVTGAMAFGKTKDIWKALKLFFGYQRKLVEFMIILWHALIQVAANIRGLFKFI